MGRVRNIYLSYDSKSPDSYGLPEEDNLGERNKGLKTVLIERQLK